MINLEKIKYEKCQAPLLRRPAPAPYFHHLFKNFSESPPPGEVIKIYFPTLKRGGPNYAGSEKTLQLPGETQTVVRAPAWFSEKTSH